MKKRLTPQREAILKLIGNSDQHWDAEGIAHVLAKMGCSIGQATVYRGLAALEKEGLIRGIQLVDGKKRYERAGKQHHDHFVCTACGSITEFSHPAEAQIFEHLSRETGAVIHGHEFVVFGFCASCREAS
ncbi:MAG: transcriptional repressor [Zetaproteobacteria bacterium]|nr:MAG: transcriptional repressor [Zetaproteobacteria bacterium]